MSLRGANSGGFAAPIPAGFDDTKDLTVLVKVRRAGAQGAADSIFRIVNAARTRGVSIVLGGAAATGGTPDEVFAVCGSGTASAWGSSASHGGRGMAAAGTIAETSFDTIIVVVRGSAAADNGGSGGAQQIHEIWKNGGFGTVGAASAGIAVSATGDRTNYLYRDGSTGVYFDGWIADVCVWQDWRPDAAAYAAIAANADPRTTGPAPLLFRSMRSVLAAEAGETAMTAAGTAPTIDAAINPPVAAGPIVPARAVHDHAVQGTVLTSATAAPTVHPPGEDAEIVNAALSTITDNGGGSYTIRLSPDDQGDLAGFVNIVARVSVKANTSIRLEADLAGHQSGLHGANCGWCHYDVSGGGHAYGDSAAWATSRVLTADKGFIRGNLPVSTVDRTYLVAFQPVWKEAFYGDWFGDLRARADVHETASVAAARAIDATLPENANARVSPGAITQQNGVAPADAYLRAVRITNLAVSPPGGKRKAVVVMGQHASEHQGDYAAREFGDWLTTVQAGAAEQARQAMLARFDWHFYNANPLGRRYGKERWTEETGGDEDPNRNWNTAASAQINALKAAVTTDTGDDFALFLDFHGAQSVATDAWTTALGLYDAAGAPSPSALRTRMTAKLGGVSLLSGPAQPSWGQGYAYGKGAAVAETVEYALGGPGFFDASGEVRISYATPNGALREVLAEMFDAGAFSAMLAPADSMHRHIAGSPSISVGGLLAPTRGVHSHAAGAAALIPQARIVPEAVLHGQTAAGAGLRPADAAARFGGIVMPVVIEPRTMHVGLG